MPGEMMKTERIEARVEPARAERIRYAAELSNTSMSAFVVDAAAQRAEDVIARHAETLVPADFFESLLSALDEGARVPALQKAAKRARRTIVRR